MSIFDPHSLYKRRQLSTKKGQIIQKRPVEKRSAYTQDDLKRAQKIIAAFPYANVTPVKTLNFNCITLGSGFFNYDIFTTTTYNKDLKVNDILADLSNDDQLWNQMSTYYDISKGKIGPFQIAVFIRHLAIRFSLPGSAGSDIFINAPVSFPHAGYENAVNIAGVLSGNNADTRISSFWKSSASQLTISQQENPPIGSQVPAVNVLAQTVLDKTGSVNYSVITVEDSPRSAFLEFLSSHEVPAESNDALVSISLGKVPVGSISISLRFEVVYDVVVEGSLTL